jgi:hypothetical protein
MDCPDHGVNIKLSQDNVQWGGKKRCHSLNFIPYSRTMSWEDNPPDVVSATLQDEECCCLMIVSIVEIM